MLNVLRQNFPGFASHAAQVVISTAALVTAAVYLKVSCCNEQSHVCHRDSTVYSRYLRIQDTKLMQSLHHFFVINVASVVPIIPPAQLCLLTAVQHIQ